ncbi:Glutamine-binding periplasmic protein precursor [Nocardioides dokdonensis FR1436]|uniref:Glutamine-binding periplasmic protein n=1 Tax=Nocardioides dokdonensis FR1436 TaxID=1300347 RepID=A0A1A9GKY9_9ACTN|nr:ABC transporter substrate-binding protein [Nocardioides dokdonensis]ANH38253.1 Glutamine-binding periplasmic protein precursor [Nocardioides dokdonensis FR1436]
MPQPPLHLMAGLAAAGLIALTACSSGTSSDAGSPASFGDCEVYGDAGTVEMSPVADGVLTVQTTLPSPGWWKGISPDSIEGGYEYCLAANIAHRAGLDGVKVANVSFDALVAGQTKDFDIAMAQVSVTPEREEVVSFSEPYFDSNLGVLAPTDSGITEDNIGEQTIGVQVGTTSVNWVEDTLQPGSDAKNFQDTTAMVTAITSGLTDMAIQDTAIMLGFAKNSGGALEVIGQYESGEQYAAIYPQDSTDQDAMDAAIEAMREDGTLDKLSATWLGPELGGDPAAVPVWTVR